jgi:hypothetical protein
MTVADAQTAIENDGFTFGGNITAGGADTWFVNGQTPSAGTSAPPNSSVSVSSVETKPASCP